MKLIFLDIIIIVR